MICKNIYIKSVGINKYFLYFYCKSAKIKNLINSSLLFCLAVNLRGVFYFMESLEIWKDVKGYEGYYKISNQGNLKTCERLVKNKNGYRKIKEHLLKQNLSTNGYKIIALLGKTKMTHQLVAESFLNHIPNGYEKVVDHIDNNKVNNNSKNLQLITNRQNSIKEPRGKSKYPGVYFNKKHKKWVSRILIGKERIYLGAYDEEIKAYLAYKNKLESITIK